ncbi:hypothetical protein DY000_02010171, partial [Brassica cretica]
YTKADREKSSVRLFVVKKVGAETLTPELKEKLKVLCSGFQRFMYLCVTKVVTTHALRCIDKAVGIDEYLLKTPKNGESHKEARRKMHGDKGGEEKGKEEASLEAGGQNHIKMIMGG